MQSGGKKIVVIMIGKQNICRDYTDIIAKLQISEVFLDD